MPIKIGVIIIFFLSKIFVNASLSLIVLALISLVTLTINSIPSLSLINLFFKLGNTSKIFLSFAISLFDPLLFWF